VIIAFDLDGTLANIEHRLHFIQGPKKDWPSFYRACPDDKPTPLMDVAQLLMRSSSVGYPVWIEIWSGRSNIVFKETEDWLVKHGLMDYTVLRMRKDGDYRQDAIVKAEWFDALAVQDRPTIAFDDRQQVVDMWRSRGVICCQVAKGDF
jgi:hypothetical protein